MSKSPPQRLSDPLVMYLKLSSLREAPEFRDGPLLRGIVTLSSYMAWPGGSLWGHIPRALHTHGPALHMNLMEHFPPLPHVNVYTKNKVPLGRVADSVLSALWQEKERNKLDEV